MIVRLPHVTVVFLSWPKDIVFRFFLSVGVRRIFSPLKKAALQVDRSSLVQSVADFEKLSLVKLSGVTASPSRLRLFRTLGPLFTKRRSIVKHDHSECRTHVRPSLFENTSLTQHEYLRLIKLKLSTRIQSIVLIKRSANKNFVIKY